MADSESIGVTQATAKKRHSSFRRLYGLYLLLQILLCVLLLIKPHIPLEWLGLANSGVDQWARICAGTLLLATFLQIPGYTDPINGRVTVVIGIIGGFGLAILFACLGGVFYWLAAIVGLFAVLLYVLFRRTIVSELQTRP